MKNAFWINLTLFVLFFSACTEKNDLLEQNKALIIKANEEILNKGNLSFVDEVFSQDYSDEGPGWIKDYIGNLRTAFPDLHVTIEPIIAEGDRVAWRRTHTGTH